jgi:hypothetical protein
MSLPDIINGLFEFAGALAGFWNVATLLRQGKVRGFSPMAYVYFTAWGTWNCFYYPHLGQWFSLAGTIAITVSNGLFAGLAIYFSRRQHE